jgi:hypothetical protein
MDWVIGFIVPYTFAQLGDCRHYSAVPILHTFQFTVTRALVFSVFTSHMLATDLSQSQCNFKLHIKPSCHYSAPANSEDSSTLDYSRLLSTTVLYYFVASSVSFYNPSARTRQKTQSSFVKEACSQLRCPAIDVVLLSAFVAGMCLPSSCLGISIYVTI